MVVEAGGGGRNAGASHYRFTARSLHLSISTLLIVFGAGTPGRIVYDLFKTEATKRAGEGRGVRLNATPSDPRNRGPRRSSVREAATANYLGWPPAGGRPFSWK